MVHPWLVCYVDGCECRVSGGGRRELTRSVGCGAQALVRVEGLGASGRITAVTSSRDTVAFIAIGCGRVFKSSGSSSTLRC